MLYCREKQLQQERRRSEGDLSTLVSGQCRGPAPTEAGAQLVSPRGHRPAHRQKQILLLPSFLPS